MIDAPYRDGLARTLYAIISVLVTLFCVLVLSFDGCDEPKPNIHLEDSQ